MAILFLLSHNIGCFFRVGACMSFYEENSFMDKLSKRILKYLRENPRVGEMNYNDGIFGIAEGSQTEIAFACRTKS